MKLKNSYILLIAIVMLLVSIGSVCASEDVTTDDNVVLASSEADTILTDGESGDTTQEKINTTVEIPEDTYSFKTDENQVIPIDIKDNESKSIEFTQSDLTITDNENRTIEDFALENNNITFMSPFAVGNYTLTINYNGNATYTNSLKNVTLLVTHEKELTMPSEVVSEKGENVVIPINVDDGLTNYTVNQGDLNIKISYINSEGAIETQDATFTVSNNNITITSLPAFIEANVTVNYTESSSVKTAKIKLLTSVDVSATQKINTTADKVFTLSIKDGNGNTITITSANIQILKGDQTLSFTYEDNKVNITSPLDIGTHNLTIKYLGNNTYAESNGTTLLGVFGNSTFSAEDSTNVDANKQIHLQLNLTDGVDPVAIKSENLNITVNYIDANGEAKSTKITSFTVDGQVATFDFTESFKSANLTVSYLTDEGKTFDDTVIVKVNTTINAEDEITKGNKETLNFTANVTSADGVAIDFNENNFKVFNGETQLNTTYADGAFTIHNNLTYGVYNLTIRFTGNDTYSDAVKNLTLKILGFNTNNVTTVDVNSTRHGEVKLNLTDGENEYPISLDDLNITVYYTNSSNETVNVTLKNLNINNNTLTFDIEDDNITSATFLINYKNSTEVNLTLNRVYNVRLEVINNEAEYQSGNFTYKVVDIDAPETPLKNKTIKLEYRVMSGTITFQQTMNAETDNESIVVFKNSQIFVSYFNLLLGLGVNTVTISGDNLKVENPSQNVTITQAKINITIDPYSQYYGSDEKVKIHVVNANTGDPMKFVTLHLYMSNSSAKDYYFQTNENGTSEISVNGLVGGTYPIKVNNNDTENMTAANASGDVIIKKIPVVINAKDVTMYYNSGTTATIKITRNGVAQNGVYVLVRLYSTSSKYNDYLFQTNKKGEISFSAPLAVGKHKMIVVLADNRYEASQVTKTITVKKATAKITAAKVTSYYKDGKYFTVKLTNTKNKKAIYGAKLNVKIFVSKTRYYNFNGQTGADGKIRLTINLKPGTYNVEITGKDTKNFKASKATSKITVKKSTAKFTIKKSNKKYVQVTVKNKKTKKALVGLKVKIKVKSKTYTVKTNSKGIAKVSKVFKAGKYAVSVKSAEKYCSSKTAKATVRIK